MRQRWAWLLAFGLISHWGAVGHCQQDAAALLDKMAKGFAAADALRLRSSIVVEQQMGDAKAKQTVQHEAIFQRPNLLRVRWTENGSKGLLILCDGRNLFTQVDALQQVKKEAAPKSLQQIVRGDRPSSPVVDPLSCFLKESWREKVESAKVAGTEKLRGRQVTKVTLTLKGGAQQTLWLDADGRPWRTQRIIKRAHPGGGTMTVTVDETFQEVTLNPKLPKTAFRYTVPKGYRQVAEFEAPQSAPKSPR
ncbi:MAG: hypothetical protein OXFUSZZB_001196 [Candidatus Fervidibacter sp.]|jgi:outer membrane lipoprotein-sorting protein